MIRNRLHFDFSMPFYVNVHGVSPICLSFVMYHSSRVAAQRNFLVTHKDGSDMRELHELETDTTLSPESGLADPLDDLSNQPINNPDD